jgi:Holliday junction resolvase RusA-like endonuclease
MAEPIRFFVPGIPRPGGSKKGFYIKKLNRVVVTEDNKRSKDWRASVGDKAFEAVTAPLAGPLRVTFAFYLPRPKGHFNSRGEVRPSAPKYPTGKPDVTKLIRSTEDAMKGIAWNDDSQIVEQPGSKQYTTGAAGAWIVIEAL